MFPSTKLRQACSTASPRPRLSLRPRSSRSCKKSGQSVYTGPKLPISKNAAKCCWRTSAAKCRARLEELTKLPGVGRKTANVVMSVGFHIPAIAVDTHVERISKRLRIAPQKASVLEVEELLMKKIPKERWSDAHHQMIFFGRYHCTARNPKCEVCPLLSMCQEGQKRLGLK